MKKFQKKRQAFLLSLFFVGFLFGCSGKTQGTVTVEEMSIDQSPARSAQSEEPISVAQEYATEVPEKTPEEITKSSEDSIEDAKNNVGSAEDSIDIDLLSGNANMVYATVFQMTLEPKEYEGKTLRVRGVFRTFPDDPDTGEGPMHRVVFIADAAACCQQGLEILCEGEYSFEDPEPETVITVTGRIGLLPNVRMDYPCIYATSVETESLR